MVLYGFHRFLRDLVSMAGFSMDFIDFRWICVDFMDLGVFWGEKVANL